ncbi:hypothetical protein ACFWH7_04350 [Cellulosimicrobium cellulans]|uniref:hypothetical protein n=1 Tax=Cellulosimicrobium cellulans TaxID=1710 RepID=UPI00365B8970
MTTTPTSRLALILTLAFWRAAGIRALRTALVAAAPLLLPLVGGDWGDVAQAAGAIALVAVLSLATSLWSLPELGAGTGPWAAVLDRTARTFGQTLAASLATATLWSDVDWTLVVVQALAAALTTAVLAAAEQLPETIPVVEPGDAGVYDITSLTPEERATVNDIRAIHGRAPLPPS